MALLRSVLTKKFGKNYDRTSKEVIDSIKEFKDYFRKRYFSQIESGIIPSFVDTLISPIDFYVDMEVTFRDEVYLVIQSSYDKDIVQLKNKENGELFEISSEELDTEYYWDDFFTRLNDDILKDLGFEEGKEIRKDDTVEKIWNYTKTDIPKGKDFLTFSIIEKTEPKEEGLLFLLDLLKKSGKPYFRKSYTLIFINGSLHLYTRNKISLEQVKYWIDKFKKDYYPLEMTVDGDDVIITDPCYILDHNQRTKLREKKLISCDTVYGDWSCTLFNTDTQETIGHFCADGGRVCVLRKKDLDQIKPGWEKNLPPEHCYTIVKNFIGKIYMEYDYFNTEENKLLPDAEISVVGKGNINFKSKQTGF